MLVSENLYHLSIGLENLLVWLSLAKALLFRYLLYDFRVDHFDNFVFEESFNSSFTVVFENVSEEDLLFLSKMLADSI